MATSGNYNFNLTRDQLIQEALINIGAYDPEGGGPLTANQLYQGATRLNAIVKAFQADGLQIWTRKLGVVFIDGGPTYQLGSNNNPGGDHASLSHVATTAASQSGGASSLTLASVSGISIGDNISAKLVDNTRQWLQVQGIAGNVVTLNGTLSAAVPDSSAVYAYTTKLARPLRVNDGFLRNTSGLDSPVRVISKEEYYRFGNKTSTGTTTQVLCEPLIGFTNLTVYPVDIEVNDRLFLELHYPFQDFTLSGQTADFPQEWQMALIWALSKELAASYGVTETRWGMIREMAEYWHNWVQNTSQENSAQMQPDPSLIAFSPNGL